MPSPQSYTSASNHYNGGATPGISASAGVTQAANIQGNAVLVPVATVNPMQFAAHEPEVEISVNSHPEMFRLASNESTGDLL